MATWDYPASLTPQLMEWGSAKSSVQFRSPFNGAAQGVEFPGERWLLGLTLPEKHKRRGGEAEAFFGRLAGGTERVRVGHFLQPMPRGTLRGAPTVQAAAARGALELKLLTGGTLEAGDFFKIGAQLYRAFQRCAPVGGVLTVPLVQRVRAPVAAGAAVLWDRPTTTFIMPATTSRAAFSPRAMEGMTVELEEDYAS